MNPTQIEQLIPHRKPMLLVDEVVERNRVRHVELLVAARLGCAIGPPTLELHTVPEPATSLISGLAALILLRRRR